MPERFVVFILVTGFKRTCRRPNYYKWPSVAAEGGSQFTRLGK